MAFAGQNVPGPRIGEWVYDEDGNAIGQVVRREGTTVWYVPVDTEIRSTHQGNLHDKDGDSPWRA